MPKKAKNTVRTLNILWIIIKIQWLKQYVLVKGETNWPMELNSPDLKSHRKGLLILTKLALKEKVSIYGAWERLI